LLLTPPQHHYYYYHYYYHYYHKGLTEIEALVTNFETKYPQLCSSDSSSKYLCGKEISLADATLFPTAIFLMFMLPQFFNWKDDDVLGPRLMAWYKFMLTVPVAKKVYDEMIPSLEKWKSSGRFNPIIEEMKSY